MILGHGVNVKPCNHDADHSFAQTNVMWKFFFLNMKYGGRNTRYRFWPHHFQTSLSRSWCEEDPRLILGQGVKGQDQLGSSACETLCVYNTNYIFAQSLPISHTEYLIWSEKSYWFGYMGSKSKFTWAFCLCQTCKHYIRTRKTMVKYKGTFVCAIIS